MYLNCKTNFSFCYGTFTTRELVETALGLGVSSLALTNINSTAHLWEFVKLCRVAGIKPIPGVEIRNGNQCLYILIAATDNGLTAMHSFLSEFLLEKKAFPKPAVVPKIFEVVGDGFIIYPLGIKEVGQLQVNERIGIAWWELHKLFSLDKKALAETRGPITGHGAG